MHYNWRLASSLLLFTALIQTVVGGWIPSRKIGQTTRRDGKSAVVKMPDLGNLAKYVRPREITNDLKRQASGSTTVTRAQLQEMLLEIRATKCNWWILSI